MNPRYLLTLLVVCGIAALFVLLGSPSWGQQPTPAPTTLGGPLYVSPAAPPEGTIFATRNSEVVGNRKPAQWNHSAVMGPNGYVIESQQGRGVLAVPFETFYRRYPVMLAFRVAPLNAGSKIASAAVAQLGQPYRLLRDNCADLVRRSVNLATHTKHAWDRPSDVVQDRTVVLWRKDARAGWKESPSPFEGATNSAVSVTKTEGFDRRAIP